MHSTKSIKLPPAVISFFEKKLSKAQPSFSTLINSTLIRVIEKECTIVPICLNKRGEASLKSEHKKVLKDFKSHNIQAWIDEEQKPSSIDGNSMYRIYFKSII